MKDELNNYNITNSDGTAPKVENEGKVSYVNDKNDYIRENVRYEGEVMRVAETADEEKSSSEMQSGNYSEGQMTDASSASSSASSAASTASSSVASASASVGGSLGASFLNKKVRENFDTLTILFNVIHLTGKGNPLDLKDDSYIQFDYSNNMPDIYASADIILSRAGSGVINELLALCKPMLLVPLSKKCSRGDQIENANLKSQTAYV